MSIDLPAEFADFVDQELASGKYGSAADVVCRGLKLLQEQQQRFAALRHDIDAGLEQLDRGAAVDCRTPEELQEFFADIERRGRERLRIIQGDA